jgi:hypothetical protein
MDTRGLGGTKSETRNPNKFKKAKSERSKPGARAGFGIAASDFGFVSVSGFELRI